MRFKTSVLLFLILVCQGCANNPVVGQDGILNFDVSPDNTQIIFSYGDFSGASSIFIVNIGHGKAIPILQSNGLTLYSNPRFSPDGKSILFIKHKKDELEKSTLCIANIDGSNVEQIVDHSEIITEAIFSNNKKDLIFCGAKTYGKHSPLGIANAHNFDIFSVNRNTKQISKLSNLDAYRIKQVIEVDSSYVVFRLEAGKESGIYSIEKGNPDFMKKIAPSNNPRKDESYYSNPVYDSQSGVLIFTAPYELYSMNLFDRVATLIYDAKGVSLITSVKLCKIKKRVLFKKQTDKMDIYSIDFNGKGLERIHIEIEK